MAKRERPGQVRVHRGLLKAERVEVLWPEGACLRGNRLANVKEFDKFRVK